MINVRSQKGFTLIELLVVVAIIGILATAGIPQYRRMVAKSRQSEAKVALGEVATGQAAFFSEYGAYGNNLRAMGVQSDIVDAANNSVAAMVASKLYMYGYITAACAAGGTAVVPTAPSNAFDAITANNPAYFAQYNDVVDAVGAQATSSTVFGRITRDGNCGPVGIVVPAAGNQWSTYTVAASGVVRSALPVGGDLDDPGNPALTDVWTVNEQRRIANTQHGFE